MASSVAARPLALLVFSFAAACGGSSDSSSTPGEGAGGSGAAGASGSGTSGNGSSGSATSGGASGASGSGTAGSGTAGAGAAGGTAGSGTSGSGAAGKGASGAAGGATTSGCNGAAAPKGDVKRTVSVGGAKRDYAVHVPPGYAQTTASPAVFVFHGYLGTAADMVGLTKMNPIADQKGFLVVYPSGLDTSWNAGNCCGKSASDKVDDVAFVKAAVADLKAAYCIDDKRVFASGMSNGGMLSHRIACELSDTFAAIGPVAGTIAISPCNPGRPVPVIAFHGTSDPIVPYAVDGAQGTKNAPATADAWAARNGCKDQPKQVYAMGDATCTERTACDQGAAVRFCTIDNGGHQWPGGGELPFLGKVSKDVVASAEILTFFEAHPMP